MRSLQPPVLSRTIQHSNNLSSPRYPKSPSLPISIGFNRVTKISMKFILNASCPSLTPRPKDLHASSPSSSSSSSCCYSSTVNNDANALFSVRLHRLVTEFKSLVEPIDRVKRLLDYATALTRLSDSTRLSENRVAGCAAQVWLEVEMDQFGRMWFGADSDSEITKGFCYCLIYLLDGASPEEVLKVKAEDLIDMNVGLPVRSRANSWANVLITMQERTKSMAAEREKLSPHDHLPSLVA